MNDTTFKNLSVYKPEPFTSEARRKTDWAKLDNDALKFAYDLLSLHHSPHEFEVANEIEWRMVQGLWLVLENPPPPLETLPKWLKIWPFCLLWEQRVK